MNKTQAQRLLDVASALHESPHPDKFSMRNFHDCGAPCCALGHYAARSDLQTLFSLIGFCGMENQKTKEIIGIDHWDGVPKHFGLTETQTDELFGSSGCGGAKTPIQAAKYIEKFLDKHDWAIAA